MDGGAMTQNTLHSRFLGLHFGCAVADALGHWTDDTSQTLCLSSSLSSSSSTDGFSLSSQVSNYVKWWKEGYLTSTDPPGCFDIGVSTRLALLTYSSVLRNGGQFEDALERVREKLDQENYAGNGSLMRCSPIGAAYWNRSCSEVEHYARESSRTTHPYSLNGELCALYSLIVQGAMLGRSKDDLKNVLRSFEVAPGVDDAELVEVVKGMEWENWPRERVKSTGYIFDTLIAALWAFFTTDSFRDGAIKAVNLGDDADTIGCVFGGLAGAFYGVEQIPQEWLDGLRKRELIEQVAEELFERFGKTLA
ncbi:ADP-ribosylglycohydrolase [Atractiella rhizophila]|nr:ADP-ribosylglycohydrolase [Atractiella rhizophila]